MYLRSAISKVCEKPIHVYFEYRHKLFDLNNNNHMLLSVSHHRFGLLGTITSTVQANGNCW